MRFAAVLFACVLLSAKIALPQIGTGSVQGSGQNLRDFVGSLTPEQKSILAKPTISIPEQKKVCPNCTQVDNDFQLVQHSVSVDHTNIDDRHVLLPFAEKARLEAINANLWNTLNVIKGKDKEYMESYQAQEKSDAPTILQQIEMRSRYVNDLVSQLAKAASK